MKVTKMHALGNNYVYVAEADLPEGSVDLPELARRISDVRRGIGSDGMIVVGPSNVADVRMRIWNRDGSEAETCGNGLRCVAKYVFERGWVHKTEFTIETKGGIVRARVHPEPDGVVHQATVDMGAARFGAAAVGYTGPVVQDDPAVAVVETGNQRWSGVLVSMGNPHFVLFVEDAASFPAERVGPLLECHPSFAHRTNVEFVTPVGRSELVFRVWERGSGITYACGTGACAAVAAGVRLGRLDGRVTVHLLGGDLDIEVRDGHVWMTGEAVEVLNGDFRL
jgi:diaminopimelate epimerase